jgi:DNA-directed RNA polymerase specialized sigma24 family protein
MAFPLYKPFPFFFLEYLMNESRAQFDQAVRSLFFDAQNPNSHALFAFVEGRLRQFRLSQAYEVRDILIEAYTRGVKQIESGRPIGLPLAWLRRTCLNIICEFHRKQKESPSPLFDDLPSEQCGNTISLLLVQEDLAVMRWAFKQLDAESQFLLHQRIVQGQSWHEVSEALVVAGGAELSEGALRQRGFKALKKLRQLYEDVRLEIEVEWFDSSADSPLD